MEKYGFVKLKKLNWIERVILRLIDGKEKKKCINIYSTNLSMGVKRFTETKADNYYVTNDNYLTVEINNEKYAKVVLFNRKSN